jgi:hypothetical protein
LIYGCIGIKEMPFLMVAFQLLNPTVIRPFKFTNQVNEDPIFGMMASNENLL